MLARWPFSQSSKFVRLCCNVQQMRHPRELVVEISEELQLQSATQINDCGPPKGSTSARFIGHAFFPPSTPMTHEGNSIRCDSPGALAPRLSRRQKHVHRSLPLVLRGGCGYATENDCGPLNSLAFHQGTSMERAVNGEKESRMGNNRSICCNEEVKSRQCQGNMFGWWRKHWTLLLALGGEQCKWKLGEKEGSAQRDKEVVRVEEKNPCTLCSEDERESWRQTKRRWDKDTEASSPRVLLPTILIELGKAEKKSGRLSWNQILMDGGNGWEDDNSVI